MVFRWPPCWIFSFGPVSEAGVCRSADSGRLARSMWGCICSYYFSGEVQPTLLRAAIAMEVRKRVLLCPLSRSALAALSKAGCRFPACSWVVGPFFMTLVDHFCNVVSVAPGFHHTFDSSRMLRRSRLLPEAVLLWCCNPLCSELTRSTV